MIIDFTQCVNELDAYYFQSDLQSWFGVGHLILLHILNGNFKAVFPNEKLPHIQSEWKKQ